MTDLLQALTERVRSVAGDWPKYTVVGSFALYLIGYLALRSSFSSRIVNAR